MLVKKEDISGEKEIKIEKQS